MYKDNRFKTGVPVCVYLCFWPCNLNDDTQALHDTRTVDQPKRLVFLCSPLFFDVVVVEIVDPIVS
jgi:hypothetical protein